MSEAGKRLIKSAEQALEFATGHAKPGSCRVHIPKDSDPKAVRLSLNMSIAEFAEYFGLDEGLVRENEQRHSEIDSSAEHDPDLGERITGSVR